MSGMEYNGGAVMAMKGKNCVAIASDKRFGVQSMTVSMEYPKIFQINGSKTFVGFSGLSTDIQHLVPKIEFNSNFLELEDNKKLGPEGISNLLSHLLYEKRWVPYFCEPIVAGIDDNNEPFISSMDLIGCCDISNDFAVSGPVSQNLYGVCETLYVQDMNPDDLFETISQAFMSGVDRSATSGWGVIVYIITPEKFTIRELSSRMD